MICDVRSLHLHEKSHGIDLMITLNEYGLYSTNHRKTSRGFPVRRREGNMAQRKGSPSRDSCDAGIETAFGFENL